MLEYTDVVIVEKQHVEGVIEIKSWIAKNNIFGNKASRKSKVVIGGRDIQTGLITDYTRKKSFLAKGAPYILFTFYLESDSLDSVVIRRLRKICDMYAIVSRKIPRKQRQSGRADTLFNFDYSVSRLVRWLRNLR